MDIAFSNMLIFLKEKIENQITIELQKYLNLQLMLGHDKFCRFYGQTALPGIQTNS